MDKQSLNELWIVDTWQNYAWIRICKMNNEILLFNLFNWKYKIHPASEIKFNTLIKK